MPAQGGGQVRRFGGTILTPKKTKLLFWLFLVIYGYFYPKYAL
jgi:hypothetical protein